MQVYLPAELEAFVQQLVDSGAYCAPSEVVHDALWLLKDQADLQKIKLAELRKLIAVGIEQANRGELIEGEIVFAKLREKIQKHTSQTP
jgi:antitoxin ParD1/3/4